MQPSTIATNQLRQTRTKSDMDRILTKIMGPGELIMQREPYCTGIERFFAPLFQSLLSSAANQKGREFSRGVDDVRVRRLLWELSGKGCSRITTVVGGIRELGKIVFHHVVRLCLVATLQEYLISKRGFPDDLRPFLLGIKMPLGRIVGYSLK
jgi:hypothetical protein